MKRTPGLCFDSSLLVSSLANRNVKNLHVNSNVCARGFKNKQWSIVSENIKMWQQFYFCLKIKLYLFHLFEALTQDIRENNNKTFLCIGYFYNIALMVKFIDAENDQKK